MDIAVFDTIARKKDRLQAMSLSSVCFEIKQFYNRYFYKGIIFNFIYGCIIYIQSYFSSSPRDLLCKIVPRLLNKHNNDKYCQKKY